jgi:hypothetical protein
VGARIRTGEPGMGSREVEPNALSHSQLPAPHSPVRRVPAVPFGPSNSDGQGQLVSRERGTGKGRRKGMGQRTGPTIGRMNRTWFMVGKGSGEGQRYCATVVVMGVSCEGWGSFRRTHGACAPSHLPHSQLPVPGPPVPPKGPCAKCRSGVTRTAYLRANPQPFCAFCAFCGSLDCDPSAPRSQFPSGTAGARVPHR